MISLAEGIVAVCLALFIVINLDNLLRYNASRSTASSKPEIEKRIALPLLLSGIGTVAFLVESFLYVILGYWRDLGSIFGSFDIGMMRMGLLKSFGSSVMIFGYAVFIWSVLVRGRYATSWQMPEGHKLVNWGPYRYVRHPSYLAYFLMFTGFLLMWHNFLALIPLIAVPGYILLTIQKKRC